MACAQPYTNAAAALLWLFLVIHLVPTHIFIYSFYIIPRKFNARHQTDEVELNESGLLSQPLLENLMLVEDNEHTIGSPKIPINRTSTNVSDNAGAENDT